MSKFIIEIRDGIGDYEAIEALLEVMNVGRISKNDTMYCYHTEMWNGIHVSAMEKKKYGKSEKFIIHLNKPLKNE
jgi:hypothetical protein